jgi:hypothetical protein
LQIAFGKGALKMQKISGKPPWRLTTQQAAEFLNLHPGSLAIWRSKRRYNLPFVKIGKKVYYYEADLVAWEKSRKVAWEKPRKGQQKQAAA